MDDLTTINQYLEWLRALNVEMRDELGIGVLDYNGYPYYDAYEEKKSTDEIIREIGCELIYSALQEDRNGET